MASTHSPERPLRIMHFVTGGFSGATQVAVDLACAAQQDGMDVVLVLRKKRNTNQQKIEALQAKGLDVRVVSNFLHVLTVRELRKQIREWRPDVVFAHGFSDHIWGRQAAVAEKVPHIFHVEHNSRERYTPRRLRQALDLAPLTQASIGVSEGVKFSLIARGFPAQRCIAIPNGIDLERFPQSGQPTTWSQREAKIIMASRFAKQKDHFTLLQALAILKKKGVVPVLELAGGGSARLQKKAQQLVEQLGLQTQVRFLGSVNDLPQRLSRVQVFVLATHWEGMPLALVEGMAAGCACVGSGVVGVQEVIEDQKNGLLVPECDAAELALAIEKLLTGTALAEQLGAKARHDALENYGREKMWGRYKELIETTVLTSDHLHVDA